MTGNQDAPWLAQQARNDALIKGSTYMRDEVTSEVLPLGLDLNSAAQLTPEQVLQIDGLATEAARTALASLASLAGIGELDHLGGGLELIPALTLTLAVADFEKIHYTIEHAHTSIGYYSTLASLGYLDKDRVVEGFRRGLDIAGHVSWVPGGTELNGGRLGIMIPAAVGQALGLRANQGKDAAVICHCGDAGWISGQALNGFGVGGYHGAPMVFVMHRNGIQLSGTNKSIMDIDPRPVIESLGVQILEIPTLHDAAELYGAYRAAYQAACSGKPTLIYPTGCRSTADGKVDLNAFGEMYGIRAEVEAFAGANGVAMDTEVWVPGSLMSWRDVEPMMECVFLVNGLPGGKGHHDGHMKGRELEAVLANPMFSESDEQKAALEALRGAPKKSVTTTARPAPGTKNLELSAADLAEVKLPEPGKAVSPRAGSEAGYAAVAKAHPDSVFVVSCDLNPSTKLAKACSFIGEDQQFEVSIEEQVATLMTNGLAVSSRKPQLNVVSTFAAFFEGIAREGFEMWRYQRNLNGMNEGLNACFHLSHVGACTGRDHFSGWSLDWINLAIGYLPYLHRFYAPADARGAFVAVKDAAAHYGGHVVAIPRDNLPILTREDGATPLFEAGTEWEAVTPLRSYQGAKKAILAFGATAFLAVEACEQLGDTDAYVINGLPAGEGELAGLVAKYPGGVVTIEDGIIETAARGLKGFAGMIASVSDGVPLAHLGIVDPRIAPAEGHLEVWEHFGITSDGLVEAVRGL